MWRRALSSSSRSISTPHWVPGNLKFSHVFSTESEKKVNGSSSSKVRESFIAFVLGGPGSGKGTQCEKIAETFNFTHLSAGDLLRKEMSSTSKDGEMICNMIKEGNIVSSSVTVKLLKEAIESSESHKFLIDGFPRCNENRIAFEKIMGVEPEFVLYFYCPEDEMVKRVLGRNQGRLDDNIETVERRLKVFSELNLPVIDYYSAKGKVHKICATGTVEEIFEKVRPLFASCK